MRNEIDRMWRALRKMDARMKELNSSQFFKKFFKRKLGFQQQLTAYQGMHLALCVDTRDPLKQGRVRWFSPVLHIPIGAGDTETVTYDPDGVPIQTVGPNATTKLNSLEWASPISNLGGFDDCGASWVPPPGSMLCIIFLHGAPDSAFYLGTTWYRDKGKLGHPNWNYHIPEYSKIFESHRGGYMVGPNDESQVFPSNNTSNYQGFDIDTDAEASLIPDASTKTTWPHEYRISSPEKHRFTMDDGDPKCNRRGKRLEIMSSMGHYFLMKDDPYHHCGDWTNPKCQISYVSVIPDICIASFTTETFEYSPSFYPPDGLSYTLEMGQTYPCAQGPEYCSVIPETPSTTVEQEYLGREHLCPPMRIITPFSTTTVMPDTCLTGGLIHGLTDFCFSFNNKGKNKYHKHRQECFPFLANHCALVQSGMQMLSRSQHSFVMDDSVEEPRERPEWERALKEFDMDGCTGNFKGRTFWRSATGHFIEMNDMEDQPKIRSIRNGITLSSACGNTICLNDHSKPVDTDPDVHACIAGEMRGIHMRSTSDHTLDFVDDTNMQCSNERTGCSKPGPYSKNAFVRLRSGYGITMTMCDYHTQTKTDQQYFQILSPQKDNLRRGPHLLHMQEKPLGPGQIFLRAGGDYIVYSYDQMVEVVGEEKDNPANKLEFISNHKIVKVNEVYYNRAKTHVFWADDYIFLGAGKDCIDEDSGESEPCFYPVCVAFETIPEYVSAVTGIRASEHVFASSLQRPDDQCEGIASDL